MNKRFYNAMPVDKEFKPWTKEEREEQDLELFIVNLAIEHAERDAGVQNSKGNLYETLYI